MIMKPSAAVRTPRVRWRRLMYAAAASYVLLAATARPLTGPAAAAVLLLGVAVVSIGVRRAPRRRATVDRSALLVWPALGGALCMLELVAFVAGNDHAYPTLSLLLDPVLSTYPGRVVGYALWLWFGF